MATFLRTMVRITDPERGRSFYETLGFMFAGDFDIVRDNQLEATNYFFSIGDQESVLELTFNHDGRTYDLGTGCGHIAVGVARGNCTVTQRFFERCGFAAGLGTERRRSRTDRAVGYTTALVLKIR